MKKATVEDMELGNLMFGNSRGKYLVEPREDYQEIFCMFLRNVGGDLEGSIDGCDGNGWYDNEVFTIRPYYWGDDEEIAELPNFVYKPTGLEIRWYKYPLRDAYSNQDVPLEEFIAMLEKCRMSVRKEG